MTAGVSMGKKKKAGTDAGPLPTDAAPAKTPEKFSEGVKFRPSFKRKLERVAEKAGCYPGELVEKQMGQYVEAEYLVILREELRAAEDAARRG